MNDNMPGSSRDFRSSRGGRGGFRGGRGNPRGFNRDSHSPRGRSFRRDGMRDSRRDDMRDSRGSFRDSRDSYRDSRMGRRDFDSPRKSFRGSDRGRSSMRGGRGSRDYDGPRRNRFSDSDNFRSGDRYNGSSRDSFRRNDYDEDLSLGRSTRRDSLNFSSNRGSRGFDSRMERSNLSPFQDDLDYSSGFNLSTRDRSPLGGRFSSLDRELDSGLGSRGRSFRGKPRYDDHRSDRHSFKGRGGGGGMGGDRRSSTGFGRGSSQQSRGYRRDFSSSRGGGASGRSSSPSRLGSMSTGGYDRYEEPPRRY